ncbi:hypothetical protein [Thalassospira sp. A3_1]|uniref:hypothetical protein n=1 Tax=Thalassospira sp. A3_1 TaxID=2821088 RepID=UPI001AD9B0C3|nr:hypothetical protein [Thalassospira sp. A3_1]MBO9509453.1 hypothetical protein [Thalassospira sp. A3_1]
MNSNIRFKEFLPESCPPATATPPEPEKVIRLVSHQGSLTEKDFASYAAINEQGKPNNLCPCRWASCSVFSGPEKIHAARAVARLPKFRKRNLRYAAYLELNNDSGVYERSPNGSAHCDLWMYEHFNPIANTNDPIEDLLK